MAPPDEKSDRAAATPPVVGSGEPIRPCPVCGRPLTGRQTSACSDRCRAIRSRRERAAALARDLQAVASTLRRLADRVESLGRMDCP